MAKAGNAPHDGLPVLAHDAAGSEAVRLPGPAGMNDSAYVPTR